MDNKEIFNNIWNIFWTPFVLITVIELNAKTFFLKLTGVNVVELDVGIDVLSIIQLIMHSFL